MQWLLIFDSTLTLVDFLIESQAHFKHAEFGSPEPDCLYCQEPTVFFSFIAGFLFQFLTFLPNAVTRPFGKLITFCVRRFIRMRAHAIEYKQIAMASSLELHRTMQKLVKKLSPDEGKALFAEYHKDHPELGQMSFEVFLTTDFFIIPAIADNPIRKQTPRKLDANEYMDAAPREHHAYIKCDLSELFSVVNILERQPTVGIPRPFASDDSPVRHEKLERKSDFSAVKFVDVTPKGDQPVTLHILSHSNGQFALFPLSVMPGTDFNHLIFPLAFLCDDCWYSPHGKVTAHHSQLIFYMVSDRPGPAREGHMFTARKILQGTQGPLWVYHNLNFANLVGPDQVPNADKFIHTHQMIPRTDPFGMYNEWADKEYGVNGIGTRNTPCNRKRLDKLSAKTLPFFRRFFRDNRAYEEKYDALQKLAGTTGVSKDAPEPNHVESHKPYVHKKFVSAVPFYNFPGIPADIDMCDDWIELYKEAITGLFENMNQAELREAQSWLAKHIKDLRDQPVTWKATKPPLCLRAKLISQDTFLTTTDMLRLYKTDHPGSFRTNRREFIGKVDTVTAQQQEQVPQKQPETPKSPPRPRSEPQPPVVLLPTVQPESLIPPPPVVPPTPISPPKPPMSDVPTIPPPMGPVVQPPLIPLSPITPTPSPDPLLDPPANFSMFSQLPPPKRRVVCLTPEGPATFSCKKQLELAMILSLTEIHNKNNPIQVNFADWVFVWIMEMFPCNFNNVQEVAHNILVAHKNMCEFIKISYSMGDIDCYDSKKSAPMFLHFLALHCFSQRFRLAQTHQHHLTAILTHAKTLNTNEEVLKAFVERIERSSRSGLQEASV